MADEKEYWRKNERHRPTVFKYHGTSRSIDLWVRQVQSVR
jgi:hypothetical protein